MKELKIVKHLAIFFFANEFENLNVDNFWKKT